MKPKLLFVDDDLLMHQLYRPYVERAGYEMVSATDGAEALRVAFNESPVVVIMDMVMPGTDGIKTIIRIKAHEATKGIRVIAISADSQYHSLQRELAGLGVESFLTKPFSPQKLVSEIQRMKKLNEGA